MSKKLTSYEIEELEEQETFEKISRKKPRTENKHVKTTKRKKQN